MECKHVYTEDEYDENLSCFHKVTLCKLNKKPCQGTEGVCSKFEGIEEKKMPEEEKPGEETEEEEEEEPKAEEPEEAAE